MSQTGPQPRVPYAAVCDSVMAGVREGKSLKNDIAPKLGLSRQRIYQILKAEGRLRELKVSRLLSLLVDHEEGGKMPLNDD